MNQVASPGGFTKVGRWPYYEHFQLQVQFRPMDQIRNFLIWLPIEGRGCRGFNVQNTLSLSLYIYMYNQLYGDSKLYMVYYLTLGIK